MITLDDLVNEAVDVYEKRKNGDKDAVYEKVECKFSKDESLRESWSHENCDAACIVTAPNGMSYEADISITENLYGERRVVISPSCDEPYKMMFNTFELDSIDDISRFGYGVYIPHEEIREALREAGVLGPITTSMPQSNLLWKARLMDDSIGFGGFDAITPGQTIRYAT